MFWDTTVAESRQATPTANSTATGTIQRPSPATRTRPNQATTVAAPINAATQREKLTPHGIARSSQSPSAPRISAAPSNPSPNLVLSSTLQTPPLDGLFPSAL